MNHLRTTHFCSGKQTNFIDGFGWKTHPGGINEWFGTTRAGLPKELGASQSCFCVFLGGHFGWQQICSRLLKTPQFFRRFFWWEGRGLFLVIFRVWVMFVLTELCFNWALLRRTAMPKIAEEVLSDKQVAVLMERAQAAVDDGWNPRMDAPVGSMSKRQPLQTTRTVTR